MLLNLLWGGEIKPMRQLPSGLIPYLGTLHLPLFAVSCDNTRDKQPEARFGDEELLNGLTLADALSGELDMEVEGDAIILFLPKSFIGTPNIGMRLAAEVLHLALLRNTPDHLDVPGLFNWAFHGVAAGWHNLFAHESEFTQLRDDTIHSVLDFPANRAEMSLEQYLTLLNPNYRAHEPDLELAMCLTEAASLSQWRDLLHASFERAECKGRVT